MKFITVLLLPALLAAVLVLFSPAVLSKKVDPLASASIVGAAHSGSITQKVDPLASSSVVRTARTEADDVSPMVSSGSINIVTGYHLFSNTNS